MSAAGAAEARTPQRCGWVCFHCGEHFPETADGARAARDHFGDDPFHSEPACIMQLNQGDRYWLRQCVQLQAQLARYMDEDSDLARLMAKQASEHATRLARAEEIGFARGLDAGFTHWREAFARLLLDGDETPRPPLGTSPRDAFAASIRAMSIEQARAILDPTPQRSPDVIATPHLRRVCELIDADNGAHHVERIEGPGAIAPIEERMAAARGDEPEVSLILWDMWLGTLTEAQLETIAAGEETEQQALLAQCLQPGLNDYLTRFFDPPE